MKNLSFNSASFNPEFVTGFIDAEGCFYVSILKNTNKVGRVVRPSFHIASHIKDQALLELIREFLGGVGGIYKQGKDSVQYRISSVQDLTDVIIPHFDKYPLITQKRADFVLFKQVVDLIKHKKHVTLEGLQQIVDIKASMNNGLPDTLKAVFPNTNPAPRPINSTKVIPSGFWVAGFVSGDGSFNVNIIKSKTHLSGYQVLLRFFITQHIRDKELLTLLIGYFNCGRISNYKSGQAIDFTVTGVKNIKSSIIPFFIKYNIRGEKAQDFSDFCRIVNLMDQGLHLTDEGLNQIRQIISEMNSYRRKNYMS